MKSYLRYEPSRCFGVITSPDANAIFDFRYRFGLCFLRSFLIC